MNTHKTTWDKQTDDIEQRTYGITAHLRWKNDILEQAWMAVEDGDVEWRPVETVLNDK